MSIAPDNRDYLADVARRLDAAGHGNAGAIVGEVCAFLGWSRDKLYRRLKADVGWTSGRKTRADKGSTSVPPESLLMLGAAQRESVRANGKQILFTPDAAQILEQNGVSLPVGNAQLNRLIRTRKLGVTAQRLADPVQTLRSLHPNHVHQVDPSLCVLYYLKNGQQAMMDADKFYKNKLDNYAKIKLKVWRYVLWDHTSSSIVTRYYEARGENPATLFEFLMWAWSRRDDREFHGVPRILVWDKGSANTSAPIKSLLKALEVEAIEHAAGKARVKGGVEGANNIIECKFESRLKFEPVQNAFNADLIQRQDNRLKRPGMTPTPRIDLWRKIRPEQLRLLPEVEACRALLEGREDVRTVTQKAAFSYRHPQAERSQIYKVGGLDGISAGDQVTITPLLFGHCAIHVRVARYDGEDLYYRLEPETATDEFGLPTDAPVWGEGFKGMADSEIERQAKRMDAVAYPGLDAAGVDKARQKQQAPFGGTLDAHSHLKDIALPTGLPKRGSEIGVPDRVQVEVKPLNHIQMATALSRVVDGWGPDHYRRMTALYPDGCLEADLGQVAERLRRGDTGEEGFRLVAVA